MTDEAKRRFYNDMLKEFDEICEIAGKGIIIQHKDKMRNILRANSPEAKSFEFLEERCAAAYYRGKLEMLDTLYIAHTPFISSAEKQEKISYR